MGDGRACEDPGGSGASCGGGAPVGRIGLCARLVRRPSRPGTVHLLGAVDPQIG